LSGSLDPAKVKGRLVYCKLGEWGTDSVVTRIGGAGTILESDQFFFDSPPIFMAPATIVNGTVGEIVHGYINSTR
jgi:hypothetical protein